jgi:soluble lytic murein transglycosylase-like protein
VIHWSKKLLLLSVLMHQATALADRQLAQKVQKVRETVDEDIGLVEATLPEAGAKISRILALAQSLSKRDIGSAEVFVNLARGKAQTSHEMLAVVDNLSAQIIPLDRMATTPDDDLDNIREEYVDNDVISAQLKRAISGGRYLEAVRVFLGSYGKLPAMHAPELNRQLLAVAFKRLHKTDEYKKVLESLLANYPLSQESVWAMTEFQNARCQPSTALAEQFSLSESTLARIAANDVGDTGGRTFVLMNLNLARTMRGGKSRVLTDIEKLAFLVRTRLYEDAENLSNEIAIKGDLQPKERGRHLLLTARIKQELRKTDESAISLIRYVHEFPSASDIPEVMFEIATRYMHKRNYADAAALFQKIGVAKRTKKPARWFEFWNHFLAGEFETAKVIIERRGYLEVIDDKQPGAHEYWHGRVLEQLGDEAAAKSKYRQVAERHPTSFYAFLSANRDDTVSEMLTRGSRIAQVQQSSQRYLAINEEVIQASSLGDSIGTTIDFGLNGMNDPAMSNVLLASSNANTFEPRTTINFGLKDAALITPFWNVVSMSSDAGIKNPYLIYSVMKAESQFKPTAVSGVGALGLLQIMPATGARLARDIGDESYRIGELRNPNINVVYGSIYLNKLSSYYGSLPLVIAAYNAGPIAVNRWVSEYGDCDIDVFLELIPYRETRKYVRSVLANYLNYERKFKASVPKHDVQKLPTNLPDIRNIF